MIALVLLLQSAAATQTFVMGGAPLVRFEIDAPLDTITGATRAARGTATVDPSNWTTSTAKVEVDLAKFTTGIALRDEDLRDQFFETSKWSTATLVVSRFESANAGPIAPGALVDATAIATLDFRGVKQALRVPVKVRTDVDDGEPTVTVSGRFDVELAAFGMKRPQRLFLKLGPTAAVRFDATFYAFTTDDPTPPPPVADGPVDVVPTVPAAKVKKKPAAPKWRFAATTPEGRGERALQDPKIGGDGNVVACTACHATTDERAGVVASDGAVPAAHTLWNAARRATLWQGFAPDAGKASSLCAKMFMLRKDDLPTAVEQDVRAYLEKIAPDATPAFDYGQLRGSKRPLTGDLAGADRARGAKLTKQHCGRCHVDGGMRPSLTVGLYEADDLVARVRRLPGTDALQMPPFYATRLTDSELRDVVAHLVGTDQERIFVRKRHIR